tara:strand:+ start:526 stop:717 length:192 start_codon:yes stop_codon:yes gene_type:complete
MKFNLYIYIGIMAKKRNSYKKKVKRGGELSATSTAATSTAAPSTTATDADNGMSRWKKFLLGS